MSIAIARAAARKISKDAQAALPVDVEALVGWKGLRLESDKEWPVELCARYYPEERLIVVNGDHIRERQRFSVSHELGHFVLGHEAVELDHFLASIYGDENETFIVEGDLEKEANAFAAELLMPRQWVKSVAAGREGRELVEVVASRCAVSSSAAWYRLMELRLGGFGKPGRRR